MMAGHHKAGLREGLARALEAEGRRPQGSRPAERGGRAGKAPPVRTPAVGALHRGASAAGSEEPEAATDVGRRRDAPRPVLRASEGRRWPGALDNLL